MKKEHKDIFFDKVSFPPGTQGLLTIVAPKCRVWGVGGYAYREKNISLCSLLIVILFVPTKVFASVAGEVNKANDLYKHGQFDDSLKLYQEALDKDDKSPVVKYDLGTALYKKGDYTKAYGYLEQAVQDKNINIKPKAEYNLGNVLYKSGMQKSNTNVNEAIKSLQEALGHYGQAIAVDSKDQDALFNQDFVKKEIERLKKKKQKQQNQHNRQNQQGQRKQQRQQENQRSSAAPQAQKQKNAQQQAQESQKELDRKQAEDLLQEYRENEEPKKLLNYMPKKINDRPVLKDW